MTMYVYHADGYPVGFLFSSFIHDLDGNPLGRLVGSHVHRLDGSYVGEFHKETVVDKPVPFRRPVAAVAKPAKQRPAPQTCPRRGIVDYGYPDVFHLLYEGSGVALPEPLPLAAE